MLALIRDPASFNDMSRRAKKRKSLKNATWLGRSLIIGGGLLVVGAAVGYGMLRSYLHSDGFRLFLSAEVGKAVGVRGEFGPFRWDGLAVDSSKFEAQGDGMVSAVRADALYTEVDLGGVRRGVWQLEGARVNRVELHLDARKSERAAATPAPEPPPAQQREVAKARKRGWLPDVVEVKDLTIRDTVVHATLDDGHAVAEGMQVRAGALAGKNNYQAEIDGGTVRLPWDWLPEVMLDRIRLRHQDGLVVVSDARAKVWKSGRIDAAGEWDLPRKAYAFEGTARDLDLASVLSESWAKRLAGTASSTFIVHNRSGDLTANGRLQVHNGVLTALPILDSLAAYADTRRFRVLPLDDASTNWEWRAGVITLNNLVLASEGLVRLEGRLVIDDGQLDGTFRLGLAPGTLSAIPGAETHVFLPGERGLLWTPLRITGTLDDPKEDLTARLVDAAGSRMFELLPETGEKVLKFTRSIIGETPSEAMEKGARAVEKGVEVIEKTSDIIREAGGLLEGILGRGGRDRGE